MVDLGGYIIIMFESKDRRTKLYGLRLMISGSPLDKEIFEIGDEILEINGRTFDEAPYSEVINFIHQCIRSRTICMRVKKRSAARLALDLDLFSKVQDAFVIAVEDSARDYLEKLPAFTRVTDMKQLAKQFNQEGSSNEELNGFLKNTPLYVTSLTATESINNNCTGSKSLEGGSVLSTTTSVVACNKEIASISKQDLPNGKDLGDFFADHINIVPKGVRTPQSDLLNARESPTQTKKLADRSSSPFQNGRTELLLATEDNNKVKTTAIVESNNNKLGVDLENRPRRRSGSSIVVLDGELDPVKKHPDDLNDSLGYNNMVMMIPSENGPHREMAVDVPDSFIARNKTPPRYPPPKPILQSGMNDSTVAQTSVLERPSAVTKPVPPPRDHLKIEKDGRLVNRALAPQLPARITNNNNILPSNNSSGAIMSPSSVEPTKDQLDSIKKYQEQIRKRREEEDRLAAQNEFLNRSLRGSRKLQALESEPQGAFNDAFEDEGQDSSRSDTPATEKELVHTQYGYGDLVASIQRLQLQLKKAGTGGGLGGLEGRIAAIQSLLLSPQFGQALAVHNKVQSVRSRTTPRATPTAQTALRDCLDAISHSQCAYTVELAALLTGYEFEALLMAHDGVASILPPDSTSPTPSTAETLPLSVIDRRYGENNIKVIKIEKSTEPLGATVKNDGDAVVIGRVIRGGAADKSGLLHEGDEILEVNGIEMRGKSINAVCDILQTMEGTLTFLIIPGSQVPRYNNRDNFLHVRAHFDYDPEEDMYIPCRELGIGFQKGDVLHIISQEDANWWQAYREGEEDQTLAGLVPSLTFQHQRENMRLAAEERMSKPQRKSTTLLCGKTNKRKKKKGAYADGGYPMYSNNVDEYDTDEILTYEEVSLYYPRANNKRPIVLIGPPNIGRHELRQRLMEDSERFAAAIPHTSRARKENEVDGQDYHFITRAQFEADILSRKFVEHGEYEKSYYGTSLDAIRSVVNSGKICVLNLHPQSLKILRTSDLKPYVVFVAPPSLEKLRQKKIRNGESYKEEELKDTIEKARTMEDKYGHFFDLIIINNDTERAYHQLLNEINSLEREPQWVPAAWVKGC
ncbi:protein PALS1 isoform X3 [Diorhabda sublineata]|uniref:protein PALS1 isoform X3 n=1 Tax=Diorhabda sublineata TaxID=1163346 RepID=UPI0024E10034|nr:protein PALS1 isoform X3 [Diorhabda sublineata]